MRRFALALALTVLVAPAGAADPAAPSVVLEDAVLATRIDGRIEIDGTGAVSSYTVTTPVTAALAARLQEMVQRFRFEPVVVDGRVVRAVAPIRLALVGTPRDDGTVQVAIEHVSFPRDRNPWGREDDADSAIVEARAVRRPAPKYPEASLRAGVTGRVLVAVRFDEAGNVVDAAVRQSALFNLKGRPAQLAPYVADLEQASLRAIRRWKFDIALAPGAVPDAQNLSGLIPVIYTLDGAPPPKQGQWTWETRTAGRPVPWLAPAVAEHLPGVSDVGDGGTFGLSAPRYRLVDTGGAL